VVVAEDREATTGPELAGLGQRRVVDRGRHDHLLWVCVAEGVVSVDAADAPGAVGLVPEELSELGFD